MKLPYVASDLDGTIVLNSNFKILNETVKDILNYQEKSDSKFMLITGRTFATTKVYVSQLDITLPVIGCNGATITDPITREVLFESVIDLNISEKLLDFAIENNIDLLFYSADYLVAPKTAERALYFQNLYKDYEKSLQPDIEFVESLNDLKEVIMNKTYNPVKFLFSFPDNKDERLLNKTYKLLSSLNLSHPTTRMQGRILVDAMNSGINKAFGLKMFAEIKKLNVKDIHVVGDNNNDLEMVELSDNGCCVGNAVEPLKKVAKKVLESIDENGVGKYLTSLLSNG
ncbi:Cof-type HAD-IIB family hydrolase [Spiroplasma tabanidicola]|uniref:HAD superfamily hydrolase n=1 Tax=Spiroplasma tabanidicola TaxID=324079 RepID=A0A6I6CAY1_9MOLU|nr:Cof-type HAD-IIB family hydrolase [Spiroplasma tabanidicola]QGS52091.1 HAD superfamily hydrolase [Spiroplasma tabanidicola]